MPWSEEMPRIMFIINVRSHHWFNNECAENDVDVLTQHEKFKMYLPHEEASFFKIRALHFRGFGIISRANCKHLNAYYLLEVHANH